MKNNSLFYTKINNWLTPTRVFFILFNIGQLLYLNSWGNAFIFDDNFQIVANQTMHSLTSIPALFLNHDQGQNISGYYRPLPYTFYTLIYFFFKNNTFPYH